MPQRGEREIVAQRTPFCADHCDLQQAHCSSSEGHLRVTARLHQRVQRGRSAAGRGLDMHCRRVRRSSPDSPPLPTDWLLSGGRHLTGHAVWPCCVVAASARRAAGPTRLPGPAQGRPGGRDHRGERDAGLRGRGRGGVALPVGPGDLARPGRCRGARVGRLHRDPVRDGPVLPCRFCSPRPRWHGGGRAGSCGPG